MRRLPSDMRKTSIRSKLIIVHGALHLYVSCNGHFAVAHAKQHGELLVFCVAYPLWHDSASLQKLDLPATSLASLYQVYVSYGIDRQASYSSLLQNQCNDAFLLLKPAMPTIEQLKQHYYKMP